MVGIPFSKVAVEIIGPFKKASARGHRYVLTVVDYATRYADAVPLQHIDTGTVAEAMWTVWTRVGVPDEVVHDCGRQFISDVMKQVERLQGVASIHTTLYHPQSNGLVERFNRTLKEMIKKTTQDQPEEWDRFLPALLFAYRETPQRAADFSPFELLYGREVRGPLAILKKCWGQEGQDAFEGGGRVRVGPQASYGSHL